MKKYIQSKHNLIHLSFGLLTFSTFILSGCGGGGNSSNDPYYSPDPSAPVSGFNPVQALDQVIQTLTKDAFAIDAPFASSAALIAPYKNELITIKNPVAFRKKLNEILFSTFGVSHVYLSQPDFGKGVSHAPLPFAPDDPRFNHTRANGPPTLEYRNEPGFGIVAILNIPTFMDSYNEILVESYITQARSCKFLIINLQDNSGGYVHKQKHLLNQILADNTCIGYEIQKSLFEQYLAAGGNRFNYPGVISHGKSSSSTGFLRETSINLRGQFPKRIAVLINEGTASSGEVVAAALQENMNAFLVGKKSCGAVLTAITKQIPGASFTYPISDFLTSLGKRIEKNPIRPDVAVSGFANMKEESIQETIREYKRLHP